MIVKVNEERTVEEREARLKREHERTGPGIVTIEGKKLVPIPPIKYTWETKKGICLHMQIPISLA